MGRFCGSQQNYLKWKITIGNHIINGKISFHEEIPMDQDELLVKEINISRFKIKSLKAVMELQIP